MFNKVDYWLEMCDDDLKAAKVLYDSKNYLWMGFICHLIAEKALKAAVASITDDVPPKIHDLPKLASLANITDLSEKHIKLLRNLMPLQIEARYPQYKDRVKDILSHEYCTRLLNETEDFLCWIKARLEK